MKILTILICALMTSLLMAGCTAIPTRTPAVITLPTELSPVPVAANPTATPPRPTLTPRAATPAPPWLADMMASLPLSLAERGVWFSNFRKALSGAGMTGPASWDERTQWTQEEARRYQEALSGVPGSFLTSSMVQHQPMWEETLGFGPHGVDALAVTGENILIPSELNLLMGEFDLDRVAERLDDLGYRKEQLAGQVYYVSPRGAGDNTIHSQPMHIRPDAGAIFVQQPLLVVAPRGEMVAEVLAVRAGHSPSLLQDPAFASLAWSLEDSLFAAMLSRNSVLMPEHPDPTEHPPPPEDWGTLGDWEALGMGYIRSQEGQTVSLSLWYADPLDAEPASVELLRRVRTYDAGLKQIIWGLVHESCGNRWESEALTLPKGAAARLSCRIPVSEAPNGLGILLWNILDAGYLRILLTDEP